MQPQCRASGPGTAIAVSQLEYQQHLSDAAVCDEIHQQIIRDHADRLCKQVAKKPATLTDDQQEILDQVSIDVASPNVHSVGIWGYAGVGKTFLTARLTQDLLQQYGPEAVRMVATTHKAARQVEKAMASHGVVTDVTTIHRLLGVKQVRDHNTGEEYFAPDKYNPTTLDASVQVVIVDETSMLEQQLYELLMDAICFWQTVIFVGDSEQIPPVSDGRLCGAFPEECR